MSKDKLAQVFHFDLYGKREEKYDFLNENSISSIEWNELPNVAPNYYMVKKDFEAQKEYKKGFKVNKLFRVNSVGIVTARDKFTIHNTKPELQKTIEEFLKLDNEDARNKFKLGKDVRDWQVNFARKDLEKHYPNKGIFDKISYRPFDDKWTFYTGKSKGFHCYPREEVMQHFLKGENIGLDFCRQLISKNYSHIFITNKIVDDSYVSNKSRERGYVFPLYLYPEAFQQSFEDNINERIPNFNMGMIKEFEEKTHLYFRGEDTNENITIGVNTFSPENLLNYIYAVLHSPSYREKYKEFLKIDFPKVPYPTSPKMFYDLEDLGGQLKEIHLMESSKVEQYITRYPIDGDNMVGKIKFEKTTEAHGKVYVNYDKTPPSGAGGLQYFDNVPLVAWEFYIGGYQPAQKWLKDRKGRKLEFEDILHYQKIIVALSETHRLMQEIDEVGFME